MKKKTITLWARWFIVLYFKKITADSQIKKFIKICESAVKLICIHTDFYPNKSNTADGNNPKTIFKTIATTATA
jgi:hypothetical protein